jgi:integrase
MTRSTGKRKFQLKNVIPVDPAVKPIRDWLPANQGFYAHFREWLQDASYSDSALHIYGAAVRLALGWLDKPYWLMDPQEDLQRVREYLATRFISQATRDSYEKGLVELAEYLCYRCQRPLPERPIHWEYYLAPLSPGLAEDVRAYVTHCQRAWLPEQKRRSTLDTLSHLTHSLRWMTEQAQLCHWEDLTPDVWFEYVDTRLSSGIQPVTLNNELRSLQSLVFFLADQDRPVCQHFLRLEPLVEGSCLPRDVPIEQLHRLWQEIQADAASWHAGVRRMGIMDQAWFLLMLHSGLRAGEVRRLRLSDLDLARRCVRIEQSKGLKDRLVCLSQPVLEALQAYQTIRGPSTTAENHVFLYRHRPLNVSYCGQRLMTYGKRCGVYVTPHQLRHTCATLLLNAGAPILTVQTILGHKHVDTTLGYARLYDGTVAADYYRAMALVESRLMLQEDATAAPPTSGQLLALVDSLRDGTLNDVQKEIVQALRAGILALAP